jgi:YVTN family beta-propeller protein
VGACVPGAEPWVTVISNDDATAYVILRRAQQVARVTNLRGAPALDAARVRVGSEPTGLAISPTGRKLYVANWAEGTVSEVDTRSWSVTRTVDLNAALAASGLLGAVSPRPGLAHPRALVVTNNGDGEDSDETVYVTEFFSQARAGALPTDGSEFDTGRQGVVYRFNAGTGAVGALITLAPTEDTGFRDAVGATSATTGGVTGCFPNQLYSATLHNGRLYVTGVCASPRGPTGPAPASVPFDAASNNFKTQVHPTLYVVDTRTNTERAGERVTLTRAWQGRYDMNATPEDGARRMPLIPVDMAFVPATRNHVAYITAYGADASFRLRFADDGSVQEVGAASMPFINLAPMGMIPAGRLPVGTAVNFAGTHGFVVNAYTRNVSVMQFSTQTVVAAVASADAPAAGRESAVNNGQRFFVTGLDRWSLRGQAWNSCESCHPDGLTDNVTWFFARGPRQTTSLDGSFDRTGAPRLFNWTAVFDEVHDFELNTRGNSGGVGAIVHRASDGTPAGLVRARPGDLRRRDRDAAAGGDGRGTRGPQRLDAAAHARRLGLAPLGARRLERARRVHQDRPRAARPHHARGEGRHRRAQALRTEQLRGLSRRRRVDRLASLLHSRRSCQRPHDGPSADADVHGRAGVSARAQSPDERRGAHGDAPLQRPRERRGQRPDPVRLARGGHLSGDAQREPDGRRSGGRARARGARGHEHGRAGCDGLQPALARGHEHGRSVPSRGQRAHARRALLRHVSAAPPGDVRELSPGG